MQELQLYINNQRVELFDDETVSLNDSIQNIKDISKVFTAFTKQFNLPASKENNKIFKHYYNNDIVGGFDARFRVSASIHLNGLEWKKGKIQLNDVALKNNKPDAYKVVFYGETVKLKELLGGDKLNLLDHLEQYDHRQQHQFNGFKTGIGVAGAVSATNREVTYPFISTNEGYFYNGLDTSDNNNIYHASFSDIQPDLKPSIKMTEVINAIEDKYDLVFSDDFFGSDIFNEIYLWCHKTKDPINVLFNGKKVKMSEYVYNAGVSVGADLLPMRTESNVYYTTSLTFATSSNIPYTVTLKDRESGIIYWEQNNVIGNLASGNSTIETTTPQDIDLQVVVKADSTLVFTNIQIKSEKYTNGVSAGLTLYDHPTSNFMQDTIFIQDHLPDMKVIDLLTTLFKMFNLTAYVDNDIIVVKTLDDYYSSGNDKDITKYVDVNKSSVSVLLNFGSVILKYAKSVTKNSVKYFSDIGSEFGDLDYNSQDKFEGNPFVQGLKIEHPLLENLINTTGTKAKTGVVYGRFVDTEDKPVLGSPYIFINKVNDVTSYPIINNGTVTSYQAPSNVSSDGNHTINFNSEFDEYTGATNENSLFSRFYSQYLITSFSDRSRVFKVDAYLPLSFLLTYNLNDTIIINSKEYLINTLTINLQTGKSRIELITKVNDFTASVLT